MAWKWTLERWGGVRRMRWQEWSRQREQHVQSLGSRGWVGQDFIQELGGTSQVVQWLRICIAMKEVWIWFLAWEQRSCMLHSVATKWIKELGVAKKNKLFVQNQCKDSVSYLSFLSICISVDSYSSMSIAIGTSALFVIVKNQKQLKYGQQWEYIYDICYTCI